MGGGGNGFSISRVEYSKTYGTTAVLAKRTGSFGGTTLGIFDSNFQPYGGGLNNWFLGKRGYFDGANSFYAVPSMIRPTMEQKLDGVLLYNFNGRQSSFYNEVTGGAFFNMNTSPVAYDRQSILDGFYDSFGRGTYTVEMTSISNDGSKIVSYGRGGGAVSHSCANDSSCSKLWARSVNDLTGYDWMIRIGPQFDAVNTLDRLAAYGFCAYVDDAIVAGYTRSSAGLDAPLVLIVNAATGQTIDAFSINSPMLEVALHIITDPRRPREFTIAADYFSGRGAYRMHMDLDNLPADGTYLANIGTQNWVISRTNIDTTTFFEETDPAFVVRQGHVPTVEGTLEEWYSIAGTQPTVSPTREDIASGASPPTVDFNVAPGDFAWEAAIYTP